MKRDETQGKPYQGLRCKIGLHAWKKSGFYSSLLLPSGIDVCARCGEGREFCGYYTARYSKEDMDAAAFLALHMRDNPKRRRVERIVRPQGEESRMIRRGDVWRKQGPCDWIKVVRV